jgi:hypothetical protein
LTCSLEEDADGNALCPGTAAALAEAEAAGQGDEYRTVFVETCMANPQCTLSGAIVNTDACGTTISTISGISADFAAACQGE